MNHDTIHVVSTLNNIKSTHPSHIYPISGYPTNGLYCTKYSNLRLRGEHALRGVGVVRHARVEGGLGGVRARRLVLL